MNEARDGLSRLRQWLADEAPDESGPHITPETLVAYHSSQLSAQEESRVQDHLVLCQGCTQLLLDLAAFPALDEPGARQLSDKEVAAQWKAVRTRIRKEEQAGAPRSVRWPRLNLSFSPLNLAYAMAATLLMVSAALLVWTISLRQQHARLLVRLNTQLAERDQSAAAATEALKQTRQQLDETTRAAAQAEAQIAEMRRSVDELSRPQINLSITDLYPTGFARGRPGEIKTVLLTRDANLFTVILNTTDQLTYVSYALEIVNQRGNLIWRGQGLQPSQFNNFTVALSRQSFPAGQYRIKLYGVRDGSQKLVEEYWLRIQYK